MNRIIRVGVECKEKRIKHRVEVEVEFAEPCTQFEAQQTILESIMTHLTSTDGDVLIETADGPQR